MGWIMEEEDFFERFKDYGLTANCYSCERRFDIEELYQAFKKRLMDEVTGKAPYCVVRLTDEQ